MYDTILVSTDGSSGSRAAAAAGLGLAVLFDSAVNTLYVVDTRGHAALPADAVEEVTTAAEKFGRSATAAVADRAGDLGLDVAREVRQGVPHVEIAAYADEHDADLVAVGTRGQTGPAWSTLGSTANVLLDALDVPVLTARASDDATVAEEDVAQYDDVLVPTDGSDASFRPVDHAVAIAERAGATVHALYVVDRTIYDQSDSPRSIKGPLREAGKRATDEVLATADDAGVPGTGEVRTGTPFQGILDYAAEHDVDLVAMGAHGETVSTTALLGSTAERVVRQAPVPVLTVP